MKLLITSAVLLALMIYSCGKTFEEQVKEGSVSPNQLGFYEVTIEGCQYYITGGSYRSICHKGNCNSLIHKTSK